MASTSQVLAPAFLTSAKTSSELCRRLDLAVAYLQAVEQTDEGPESLPPGLENLAAQLISGQVLGSRSKDIALLACCGIVEVLRLYAPSPPYTPENLCAVFASITARLDTLKQKDTPGMEASFERALGMLESLVRVRSCVVVVDLGDDQAIAFFAALLGAVQSGSSRKLEELVVEALATCLGEMDSVSSALLAVLLQCFLDAGLYPRVAAAATQVLQRCGDKLIEPVAAAVNHWLVAADMPPEDAPDEDGGSDTDADATPAAAAAAHLRSASGFASAAGRGRDGPGGAQSRFARLENVHLLLIELAQVCPAVLLHVLPALSAGLDKANAAARHAAVRVLGRLFALPVLVSSTSEGALSSSKQPLARVYDVQFIGWLGRFKDRDPEIRKTMVALAGEVLRAHAALSQRVSDELLLRLRDDSEDVRLAAVVTVCDSACAALAHVPASLLEAVAERTRDRRLEIRREAATGLAQAYAAHMPALWQHADEHATALAQVDPSPAAVAPTAGRGASPSARARGPPLPPAGAAATAQPYVPTAWEETVFAKLGALPRAVLPVYEHPEHELKLRVTQLLDHVMLPESLGDACRARGVLAIYASLDEPGRRAFRLIQLERRAVQSGVREFLGARDELRHVDPRSSGGALDRAARERLRAAINALAERTGHAAKGMAALWSLAQVVQDRRVFAALATLAEPRSGSAAVAMARDDLQARLKALVSAGCAAVDKAPASSRASRAADGGDGSGGGADMKALADTVRTLMRKMCMGTVSSSMLPHLLTAAVASVATGEVRAALDGLELAREFATVFPSMLDAAGVQGGDGGSDSDGGGDTDTNAESSGGPQQPPLQAALSRVAGLLALGAPDVTLAVLRLAASVGAPLAAALPLAGLAAFRGRLSTLMLGGPPKLAKHAALAAVAVQRAPAPPSAALAAQPFFDGLRRELAGTLSSAAAGHRGGAGEGSSAPAAAAQVCAALAAAGALALGAPLLFLALDGLPVPADAAAAGVQARLKAGGQADEGGGAQDEGAEEGEGAILRAVLRLARMPGASVGAPAGGRASASRSGRLREPDSGSDTDGGDDDDDDDDDAGFRRRSAGSKRRRGVTPPASAAAAPAGGKAFSYKGVRASAGGGAQGPHVACLALRAVAALPRGLAQLHARTLAGAQQRRGGGGTPAAGGGSAPPAVSAAALKGLAGAAATGPAAVLASVLLGAADGEGDREGGAGDAAVRTAAAVATLRLAAAGGGLLDASAVLPRHWLAASHVAADAVPAARAAVRSVALPFLRSAALPLRWVSVPVLACLDPLPAARKAARDGLAAALLAFRRASAAASQQLQAGAAAAGAGAPPPPLPYALMPEFALPFALSALAHDARHLPSDAALTAWLQRGGGSGGGGTPLAAGGSAAGWSGRSGGGATPGAASAPPLADDAVSGAGGVAAAPHGPLQAQAACLGAFCDAVLASVPSSSGGAGAGGDAPPPPTSAAAHAGCLSLLLAIAARVRECGDAIAPGDAGADARLHALADVAFQVLRARAKDQAAFHKYPGEVRLPASLFRPRGSAPSAAARAARHRPPASAEQVAERVRPE